MQVHTVIIGIGGGSGSGKSSIAKLIKENCSKKVEIINQDCFYKDVSIVSIDNWDSPEAFDWDSLRAELNNIKNGRSAYVREYDYVNCAPVGGRYITADIIIFEGILALYDPEINDLLDIKIFIDCDADVMLLRRITRDISQRGRTLDSVLKQYTVTVKPAFEQYILPTRKFANLIIPSHNDTNSKIVQFVANWAQRAKPLISWNELKSYDMTIMEKELPRDAKTLQEYDIHRQKLKDRGYTLEQTIRSEILRDCEYALTINKFPYAVEARHYVFWMTSKLTMATVKDIAANSLHTMPDNIIVFENPPTLRSIPGIEHYQVFVRVGVGF